MFQKQIQIIFTPSFKKLSELNNESIKKNNIQQNFNNHPEKNNNMKNNKYLKLNHEELMILLSY